MKFLCLMLFSQLVFAGGAVVTNETGYDSAVERYEDIQLNCIENTSYLNSCTLYQDEMVIDPSTVRKVQSQVVEGLMSRIGRHYSYHSRELFNEAESRRRANIRGLYSNMKDKAKKLAKDKKLNTCQKACLATCISSRAIDYDHSLVNQACVRRTKDGAIETQKGVCRNFAQISHDIYKYLGVKTKKIFGDNHAINIVKIDGQWYQMEPQDPTCSFYYNDKKKLVEDGATRELINNMKRGAQKSAPKSIQLQKQNNMIYK